MELLLERQAAYVAEHPPSPSWLVPLLEWFIRDGDEQLVDMAAIAKADTQPPRPAPKPRTYRPASHWRARLERLDAELAALDPGPRHGTTDPAAHGGIGIRQTARQERQWAARIDRTAARYVALSRERAEVAAKLTRAERRESA